MSSQARVRGNRRQKRPQRMTSNVFAMFDQSQIHEFKEAFNMIDDNTHDQIICKKDLRAIFDSLGKDPSDEYLEEMLGQATGPINFTMFLTMFGEKLNGPTRKTSSKTRSPVSTKTAPAKSTKNTSASF